MDSLASVVLILKNVCFNVVTVLTVLVAFGNELRRWKITYRWLEERHAELTRAWYISLVIFVGLSALYSGLKHEPGPLVVDTLTAAAMLAAVWYLKQRKSGGERPIDRRDEPDDDFLRDEPGRTRRTPRRQRPERPERTERTPEPEPEPPTRTPRTRRRPTPDDESP